MFKNLAALAVLLLLASPRPSPLALAPIPAGLQYVSPLPGAQFVNPATTIAIRQGEAISPDSVQAKLFNVVGSSSGMHSGSVVLADDQETIIFKPDQPFALGESANVTVDPGIRTVSGKVLDPIAFEFSIYAQQAPPPPLIPAPSAGSTPAAVAPEQSQPAAAPPLRPTTLPADLPALKVNVPSNGAEDGYFFIGSFPFPQGSNDYLLILDSSGQPVYYKRTEHPAMDFKEQPNGLLTYYENGTFYAMDKTYTVVNTFQAGNGYTADLHDLQLLPNGHALLMMYDAQFMDLSQVVLGGRPDATVTGLIIQELDSSKNVVFEWRSWDHFLVTDSYEDLTTPVVDYVHGNSIQVDTDGNLLLSSRHLAEVTKINRQTGDILWRLGGKHNEFTFVNDNSSPHFYYQHDVRRLPNGDITLFDNRTGLTPSYSEASEYKLDETNKTAILVWQYHHTPDVYTLAMGNVQLLPDGNRVIGWGTAGMITEIKPDGSPAFEMSLQSGDSTYRAFRFPWHATPSVSPTLQEMTDSGSVTLTYSWNGATDVSAFQIFEGSEPNPPQLVRTQARAGFDTTTTLPYNPAQCLYYRVRPVDANGNAGPYSNDVSTCH